MGGWPTSPNPRRGNFARLRGHARTSCPHLNGPEWDGAQAQAQRGATPRVVAEVPEERKGPLESFRG